MHDTGQDQRDLSYEGRWAYDVTCVRGNSGKGLMKNVSDHGFFPFGVNDFLLQPDAMGIRNRFLIDRTSLTLLSISSRKIACW